MVNRKVMGNFVFLARCLGTYRGTVLMGHQFRILERVVVEADLETKSFLEEKEEVDLS